MAYRVDIIGAGISGLSTAYYLAQQPVEFDIHVWEKDAAAGGLAGTFTLPDGGIVEKFYHHFYRRDIALVQLISELELEQDLLWQPGETGAYYARQAYRLSSPLDLLRFEPLPFLDRIRMGWLVLHAQRIKDWRSLDDLSVKDYIVKVAGQTVYDIVWKPLLYGKFGPEAEQISAAWLWAKLTDRGASRNRQGHELLGYLRGGLGRIFDAIVTRLREAGHAVHLGEAVRRIHGSADHVESIDTDAGTFATDIVIGCGQVPDIAALLPEDANGYRQTLERIGFLANVCLVLTLNRSLSEFYWTNVTEPDAPFVGIIEHTRLIGRSEYNHKHVVYLSSYVAQDDARLSMTAEELTRNYMPAIIRMFPEFTPECIESRNLWTARYAQPIVQVGYRHDIPTIASPLRNFFLCTMAQIYPNDRQVSNGVATGFRTAQHVADWCKSGIEQ